MEPTTAGCCRGMIRSFTILNSIELTAQTWVADEWLVSAKCTNSQFCKFKGSLCCGDDGSEVGRDVAHVEMKEMTD